MRFATTDRQRSALARASVLCILTALGCSTAQYPETLEDVIPLLHVEYRDGGDAPIGFLLTVLEDGQVRYYSPTRKIRWRTLAAKDLASLKKTIFDSESSSPVAALESTEYRFGCCDYREVGIAIRSVGKVSGVDLSADATVEASVKALLEQINRLGAEYFPRAYTFPIAVPSN